ncbi:MAG: HupE/UreJ family protein [Acetobacteraceae bacterium]|nr:HupE/UreJ family protein [Acetobacteraceae bacterium]
MAETVEGTNDQRHRGGPRCCGNGALKPLALLVALLLPVPALAHVGDGAHFGFAAGFLHPFTGVDHLLAMMMVGLWAGLLGGAARWALPAAFLGTMALGGALGMAGLALPLAESGILASVIVLGAVTALMLRLPLPAGMALAGLFGLLHGHAHGVEMLGGSAFTYATGFLAATALLHGAGLALAAPSAAWARPAARIAGGATALAGLLLALTG